MPPTLALLRLANAAHGPESVHPGRDVAGRRHDHLADVRSAAGYLRDQGLAVPSSLPTVAELAELRELASAVRALARRPRAGVPVVVTRERFTFTEAGTLEPLARTGWRRFVAGLVPAYFALRSGELRACANPNCRWIFRDGSRNGSRRWCEMRTCGSRMKMRRYRRRLARA